jgi:uroporphyrinogen-III synthase
VLYPRSDLARDALASGLAAAGAIVQEVEAYRTLPETEVDPEARRLAERGEVDVVTFASPSSVRNLAAALGGDLSALIRARVVCVGPITARAAEEHGLPPHAVATDASVAGLVAAATAALEDIGTGAAPRGAGDDRDRGDGT